MYQCNLFAWSICLLHADNITNPTSLFGCNPILWWGIWGHLSKPVACCCTSQAADSGFVRVEPRRYRVQASEHLPSVCEDMATWTWILQVVLRESLELLQIGERTWNNESTTNWCVVLCIFFCCLSFDLVELPCRFLPDLSMVLSDWIGCWADRDDCLDFYFARLTRPFLFF